MFRDRQDPLPAELVDSISDLLEVHALAANAQEARIALGLGDLCAQDREFVDIRGGTANFSPLRITKDATEGYEGVNLRTFNAMLEAKGFNPSIVLPFTDTGLPQVLTAEYKDLDYAEGPASGSDVLLWSNAEGVHWGPALLGGDALNPDYLFGDVNLVLYPFDVDFPDIPDGYVRFPTVAALNAYCANKVIFGNVNVWFKQDIGGTLAIPNILPPFSARLIQDNSVSFNDTLTVNGTRVRLDCGDFLAPVPFNSPKFAFNDCSFDSRSFFAVRERGTASGSYLTLTRCTGRLTVFGYPSVSAAAEEITLVDCDLVLNVGSPHDNPAKEQQYRRITISGSDVLIANNVTFPGNYVDASHHLVVNISNSILATRVETVNTEAAYYVPESEHGIAYNYQKIPMYVEATGCDLMFAHLNLSKSAWASNSDSSLARTQSAPLVQARASRLLVLDLADRGNQDDVVHTYAPPLSSGNSQILRAQVGTWVSVGSDLQVFAAGITNGFTVDRPTLASEFGALGYTPVSADATSFGSFVDRGEAAYSPTETGVISVPSTVVTTFVAPTTGVPV